MMKTTNIAYVLVVSILLLAAGCGSARRSAPLVGDREITDSQVKFGRQVFDVNCHQCHPNGTAGLGLALNNKPLPGSLIKYQVRSGVGAMPSFSEESISEEELDALVTYMKWLRNQED